MTSGQNHPPVPRLLKSRVETATTQSLTISVTSGSQPLQKLVSGTRIPTPSVRPTMKMIERRSSYPIQSKEYTPNTSPPPTLKPNEEAKEPLPASVRALKNSANSTYHGRTAIICLDGTGDQFDNDNSNVVHFISCLRKHTPGQQVTSVKFQDSNVETLANYAS